MMKVTATSSGLSSGVRIRLLSQTAPSKATIDSTMPNETCTTVGNMPLCLLRVGGRRLGPARLAAGHQVHGGGHGRTRYTKHTSTVVMRQIATSLAMLPARRSKPPMMATAAGMKKMDVLVEQKVRAVRDGVHLEHAACEEHEQHEHRADVAGHVEGQHIGHLLAGQAYGDDEGELQEHPHRLAQPAARDAQPGPLGTPARGAGLLGEGAGQGKAQQVVVVCAQGGLEPGGGLALQDAARARSPP